MQPSSNHISSTIDQKSTKVSVLQCVAVCCSVLQCVALLYQKSTKVHLKSPHHYTRSKEPCIQTKEPYSQSKEPYIQTKEPYSQSKEPISFKMCGSFEGLRDVGGLGRDPRKQKDFCTTVKQRQK